MKKKKKPKAKAKPKLLAPPPPPPPPAPKRGAARMKEQGYHLVNVWFDETEYQRVRRAAGVRAQPVATFVRKAAKDTADAVVIDLFPNQTVSAAAAKK